MHSSSKKIPPSWLRQQLLQISSKMLQTFPPRTTWTAILFESGDEFRQPPFFEKVSQFLWTDSLFACFSFKVGSWFIENLSLKTYLGVLKNKMKIYTFGTVFWECFGYVFLKQKWVKNASGAEVAPEPARTPLWRPKGTEKDPITFRKYWRYLHNSLTSLDQKNVLIAGWLPGSG